MAKSINLFLCDTSVTGEMDVLGERARRDIDAGLTAWVFADIPGLTKACLLTAPTTPKEPKWVGLLNIHFPDVESIETKSAGAVLYIEALAERFVMTFGTGHFLIEESKVVSDFGLMITANGAKSDSLRFMDSNNPSAGTKTRVQSDRLAGGDGFDLDSALAFIKRLGGVSEVEELGKSLSGSSGLKYTGPEDISLIIPSLQKALETYKSDSYKTRGLDIIGSLRPVTDKLTIEKLDSQLAEQLGENNGEFVICSPALLHWDTVGVFKYTGRRDKSLHSELSVHDYLSSLKNTEYDYKKDIGEFLKDMKSSHHANVINADDDELIGRWPIYRCLQGSLEEGGKRYTISDGKWYFVAQSFRDMVEQSFQRCRDGINDQEFPLSIETSDTDRKGNLRVSIETEGSYNQRVQADLAALYLDKETGSVPGIANQKNELCDLFIEKGLRLIHVKRGSRSSGSLHHLFRQGATAARMLRDPEFLNSISNNLNKKGRADDAAKIASLSGKNCIIEFRVIDTPRANGDFDIPFFAKVALHYAAREIANTGCKAKIGFVGYEEAK